MKQKISALIDGELDVREVREVCLSIRKDGDLRYVCSTYALIGDALRGEPHLATEIGGSVLDQLANEPVILAPGGLPMAEPLPSQHRWMRPALAMAATVAGVSVVSWLALTTGALQEPSLIARNSVEQPPMVVAAANPDSAIDMQEYLIAHQIQGGSMFLSGDTQHIRTVSLAGTAARQ